MASETRVIPFIAAFLISAALGAAFPFVMAAGTPALPSRDHGSSADFRALKPSDLPKIKPAPEFSLNASDGKTISTPDLRGKIWIANFFFTSCKGPCPRMIEQLSRIYKLHRNKPAFAAVSITIDPQTDTQAKLAEYSARLGADQTVWHFLTGPKDKILSLSNDGFFLAADEERGHSAVFVLIDRDGMVRGYYQSADPDKMARLVHDLDMLLAATPDA